MWIRSILPVSLLVASALSLAACVGQDEGEGGLPACPDGGTELTYDNFGQAFFATHCTDCHAAGSGQGEAESKPFETLADIQADIEEIYAEAGGANDTMPPGGGPTAEERDKLAEWLSCGAK